MIYDLAENRKEYGKLLAFHFYYLKPDLQLFSSVVMQTILDQFNRIFVRLVAVHKRTTATTVHDLSPTVAHHFRKSVVTVNDGVIDDLGIGQYEIATCSCGNYKKKEIIYVQNYLQMKIYNVDLAGIALMCKRALQSFKMIEKILFDEFYTEEDRPFFT
uniref:Uncharacterized protein n=1 Tax=Romanomermis culicivorax TaxID=13658 RepID=A0A915IBE8_ROMCU